MGPMAPGAAPPPLPVLDPAEYAFEGLELLPTPRLVVYERFVAENIDRMRRLLDGVVPGSGFRHLMPHVKTHKSLAVMGLFEKAGIESYKASLNELDLCLEAGARDVFVAYPLLAADAERLAVRASEYPRARITAQVGRIEHAERLAAAARRKRVEIDCLIDLDVGGRRTGIPPEAAADLARAILGSPRLGSLRLAGIHAYDGHNRSSVPEERAACARETMDAVVRAFRDIERAGASAERVVVAGTPPFLQDLEELAKRHRLDADIKVSPGTWVYWDTGYDRILPGLFRMAALVLAQVIDLPGEDLVTLNAGHKRWAIDQGPVEAFSAQGLEFASASEEHTVLRARGQRPPLEARIFLAPRHVCPTVNAWETFTWVGMDGRVEAAAEPVSARNR